MRDFERAENASSEISSLTPVLGRGELEFSVKLGGDVASFAMRCDQLEDCTGVLGTIGGPIAGRRVGSKEIRH